MDAASSDWRSAMPDDAEGVFDQMFLGLKMMLPQLPDDMLERFKEAFDEELMRRKVEA